MNKTSVIVLGSIAENSLRRIINTSSKLEVQAAWHLLHGECNGDSALSTQLDTLLSEAEVLYVRTLPKDILKRAPRLKWIQAMDAGVDHLLNEEIISSPVTITNVSGIHSIAIGEFVLGLMLSFTKKFPHCLQLQNKRKWERYDPPVLYTKTVGIVGLGRIGREIARLSKALGMRVLATRRTTEYSATAHNIDTLFPLSELEKLLKESDFVVIATPLSDETRGMIGETELKSMKTSAYLINIARGPVIDEESLIHALKERWIAGAGLDVFDTEPLPTDSELWGLPNVICTPHVSGNMEDYDEKAVGIFTENITRYLEGKELINTVNKKKGY